MNTRAKLTRRENEIAELLSYGFAKKEIALVLFISARTVENTTRNIYEKLGINSVAQLGAWHFHKKHNISFDRYHELRKLYSKNDITTIQKRERGNNLNIYA